MSVDERRSGRALRQAAFAVAPAVEPDLAMRGDDVDGLVGVGNQRLEKHDAFRREPWRYPPAQHAALGRPGEAGA